MPPLSDGPPKMGSQGEHSTQDTKVLQVRRQRENGRLGRAQRAKMESDVKWATHRTPKRSSIWKNVV